MDSNTLEWAARWIEGSLNGETDARVIEFGKNMAMTLRAATQADLVDEEKDKSGEMKQTAPSHSQIVISGDKPLTDAYVDGFLKEHENDPVDERSVDRIEWLFRRKLADDALTDGREWLRSYQEDLVEKGRRVAADTELLYGGTKLLIEKLLRVVETLALKPSSITQANNDPKTTTAPEHGPASPSKSESSIQLTLERLKARCPPLVQHRHSHALIHHRLSGYYSRSCSRHTRRTRRSCLRERVSRWRHSCDKRGTITSTLGNQRLASRRLF